MTTTNLSPGAAAILAALRAKANEYSEIRDGAEWRGVYLDNAIPQDKATRRSLPGLLSALQKAGLYRQVDGYAFGEVMIAPAWIAPGSSERRTA